LEAGMLTGSNRKSTGPARMPPPRPPSPVADDSPSEDEQEDERGIMDTYQSLNPVQSTPARREAIRAIVPALDFDRLKKPVQSRPPVAKPDESMAWPSLFGDVKPKAAPPAYPPPKPPITKPTIPPPVPPTGLPKHAQPSLPVQSQLPTQLASMQAGATYVSSSSFQSQFRAAEREAKRQSGVDTLDFLSKLELVEALEGGITPSAETSGSAPPHYKGSPMRNGSPMKAGFLDDTRLPISSMLEKPATAAPAVKPKKPKKAKKAGGKEGSAKAKAALKAKPLVSSGFANLVSGRW